MVTLPLSFKLISELTAPPSNSIYSSRSPLAASVSNMLNELVVILLLILPLPISLKNLSLKNLSLKNLSLKNLVLQWVYRLQNCLPWYSYPHQQYRPPGDAHILMLAGSKAKALICNILFAALLSSCYLVVSQCGNICVARSWYYFPRFAIMRGIISQARW